MEIKYVKKSVIVERVDGRVATADIVTYSLVERQA